MPKDEIKQIDGIWTEDDVAKVKAWTSSSDYTNTILDSLQNAQVQSKIIERMAIVDPKILKIPFTYIIE